MINFSRGIDEDSMELVRYAESECQVWFNANEMVTPTLQPQGREEPQVLSLGNICMIDDSWTSTGQFSGNGWVWMDSFGKVQLMGTQNCIR